MSTEGLPGPMLPSPTPPRRFNRMSRPQVLAWANGTYQSQNARFAVGLANTPDAQLAADFGIAAALVQEMKAAVAGFAQAVTR